MGGKMVVDGRRLTPAEAQATGADAIRNLTDAAIERGLNEKAILKWVVGGSAIRRAEKHANERVCGDVDLAILVDKEIVADFEQALGALAGFTKGSLDKYERSVKRGDPHPFERVANKSFVMPIHGSEDKTQVDIFMVTEPGAWGAVVQFVNGSGNYNVILRKKAIRAGFILSQQGLFERAGTDDKGKPVRGKMVECLDELAVYKAIGEPFVPPSERDVP